MKSCKCGTTRESIDAEQSTKYSFSGYLKLLWGMTAIPTSVEFKCKKCGKVFDSFSEMELKNYRY